MLNSRQPFFPSFPIVSPCQTIPLFSPEQTHIRTDIEEVTTSSRLCYKTSLFFHPPHLHPSLTPTNHLLKPSSKMPNSSDSPPAPSSLRTEDIQAPHDLNQYEIKYIRCPLCGTMYVQGTHHRCVGNGTSPWYM